MSDYLLYFIAVQLALLWPSIHLFRRYFEKKELHPARTYSVAVAILAAALLIWLFAWINTKFINPWIRSDKFDAVIWKNNETQRYRMVDDVIANKLLLGQTKADLIEMMGAAEDGPCTDCIGYSTYEPDQGFSLDHEVLEIQFDDRDVVIGVRINAW